VLTYLFSVFSPLTLPICLLKLGLFASFYSSLNEVDCRLFVFNVGLGGDLFITASYMLDQDEFASRIKRWSVIPYAQGQQLQLCSIFTSILYVRQRRSPRRIQLLLHNINNSLSL
jgi:hypothetical protein